MWLLAKTELRYWSVTIAGGYALAAVLAVALLLERSTKGTTATDQHLGMLAILTFVPYYVALGVIARGNRTENRLALHLLLPVRPRQVGVARILVAVVIALLGLALGTLYVAAAGTLGYPSLSAGDLLTLNLLVFLLGQTYYLVDEAKARGSRKVRFGWPIAWVTFLFLVFLLPPPEEQEAMSLAWERLLDSPLRLALYALAAPAILALNLWLFERRKSWLAAGCET